MKYIISLIVVLLAAGCNRTQDSPASEVVEVANPKAGDVNVDAPIPKNWQGRFSEDAEPLVNVPSIISTSRDGIGIQVTVKNAGSTTLQYYSAGVENIQLFQETFEAGEWKMGGWDWCGTGKELFEVPPNTSVELAVEFWDADKRERMLASFSEKGTERSGFVVLATEPEN